MQTNTDTPVSETFEFEFDSATRSYLAEIDKEMQDAIQKAALPWVQKQRTVMELLTRQNKLTGEWRPRPDGSGMTRVDAIPPQPDFTKINPPQTSTKVDTATTKVEPIRSRSRK